MFVDDWEIIETHPHDRASFTQGLEVHPSSVRYHENRNRNGNSCDTSDKTETEPETVSSTTTCTAAADANADALTEQEQEQEERLWVTETTGNHGESWIRTWDLATGVIRQESKMDHRFFGEGSTFFVDADGTEKIAVLTYKEQSILVYDAHSLDLLETIEPWPSPTTTREGWGIAFDPNQQLFMVTDGSEYIHFWNLDFEEALPKIPVTIEKLVAPNPDGTSRVLIPHVDEESDHSNDNNNNNNKKEFMVNHLNELEWDASTNTLLANRWTESIVVRIRIDTNNNDNNNNNNNKKKNRNRGVVTNVYNFEKLYPPHIRENPPNGYRREDVFNGIAIVPNTDSKEWLVTGKWWPTIYKIRIQE